MSVIVAIKENDVVYMGADSQTTAGMRKRSYLNETGFKIVRLENGILVGFCGRVAAKQVIMSMDNVFTLDENGELTKRHIVKQILPKLVDKMQDIGGEQSGDLDVSILLAYKGNLYRIGPRLDVFRLNEYGRSGSGLLFVDYALRKRTDLPIRERILKALTDSAKRTDTVGGPYVLIDTKNLAYEIVDLGGENY